MKDVAVDEKDPVYPEKLDVRLRVHKVIENSTFHGLLSIYRAENFALAVIYLLLFLISTGCCIYQVAVTVNSYLKYETITTSEMYSLTQSPSEYPVIQFCNLNPFDQNYANSAIDQLLKQFPAENFTNPAEYANMVSDYIRFNLLKEYMNDTYRLGQVYGFEIGQMLISCRFQNEPCSRDDFLPVYDFVYGQCFRFNQGINSTGGRTSIRSSGHAGSKHGLQLELYTGSSSYQEKYVVKRGFSLGVFNKSSPYQSQQDIGLDVATGLETSIAIRRTFINHLPSPYGDCLSNDITLINWSQNDVLAFMYEKFVVNNYLDNGLFKLNLTVQYSQSLCTKLCLQKFLYSRCGCYDISKPKSQYLVNEFVQSACVSTDQIVCLRQAQAHFYSSSEIIGECFEKCPVECNEIKYDYEISQATYPTDWYAQVLMNSDSFNNMINYGYENANDENNVSYTSVESLARSVLKVNIFYQDMLYSNIKEIPAMSFETFVANVGGSLGASIMSFTLVVEVVYHVLSSMLYFVLQVIDNKRARDSLIFN